MNNRNIKHKKVKAVTTLNTDISSKEIKQLKLQMQNM